MSTRIEVIGVCSVGDTDGAKTEEGAGCEPAIGTTTITTYNIRDGRGEGESGEEFIGIVLATRALDMVGVDVAVLQETKITDPVFASRSFEGKSILGAAADSDRRGGVALLIRENDFSRWTTKKRWGRTLFFRSSC